MKSIGIFSLLFLIGIVSNAHARTGSLSIMGSYSKTHYGNNTYSSSRRYTGSIAYNLTPVTEVELSYTDGHTFFNYDPVQTTAVDEQTLSLSLIQSLVPPSWVIQPYAKAGAAQYNRRQSGTINGIPTAEVKTKSPSAILGGGVRIFLLSNFSLKAEVVYMLPNMKVSEAKNNFSAQGGVGWHF